MNPYLTTKESYDKIAGSWTEKNFKSSKMDDEATLFMERMHTGKKILDVGCGPGRYSKQFIAKGFDSLGIDFSSKMLDEARRLVPEGSFQLGDVLDLKFADNSFDGVWCFAVLHHIKKEDAAGVLKGFRRILKNGGLLAISVKGGTGEQMDESEGVKRLFAYYSQEEMVQLVKDAGFRIIESRIKQLTNAWVIVFANATK